MFTKQANKDFKNKINNRIKIFFSKKRCKHCLSHLGDIDLPLDKMVNKLIFSNKQNLYNLLPQKKLKPVSYSFNFQDNFVQLKLRKNRTNPIELLNHIKFFIICKNCQGAVSIKTPHNFFG